MRYIDTESILIYSGRIANELLNKGYRIKKVLPDKRNKLKTVFIFAAEGNIEDDFFKLTQPEASELFTRLD